METITEAPDTLYAFTEGDFAGFACNYADPYNGPVAVDDGHPEGLTAGPMCWVPMGGGEIEQESDSPEGGTVPTGIILTAAQVSERVRP